MKSAASLLAVMLVLAAGLYTSPAAAAVSAPAAAVMPSPVPCSGSRCWFPPLSARWQYQLQAVSGFPATGGINTGITAVPFTGGKPVRPDVFTIDLYMDASIAKQNMTLNTAAVNAIHAIGAKAICYVNAGAWESWRVDAAAFPKSVLGKNNGWGEKWLDIRQLGVLLPIMQARVQKCAQAGFDGVEWDNVDGYSNQSGFPLTAQDQLVYNASLANLAHQAGLTVGLKNDVEQLAPLAPYFDYAVNEQCDQYSECSGYTSAFIRAGKAVFQVEYKLSTSKFCKDANADNRNAIHKKLELYDSPWTPCR